jgi:PAS domain S-box-containing protein
MHIGFLLLPPHQWFWAFIGHAAQQHAARLGVAFSTISLEYPPLDRNIEAEILQQVAAIEEFMRRGVHALIIPPLPGDDPRFMAALHRANAAGLQIVAIDASIGEGIEGSVLFSDNTAGAEALAAYVAERLGGRGAVVHLQGHLPGQVAVERSEAVHRILDRYPEIAIVFEAGSVWLPENGAALMRQALASNGRIDAVIAASDGLALGALAALEEQGRADSVLVTGFDGMPDALVALHSGRLAATVRQSPERIGSRAVELAVELAQGLTPPPLVLVDVELVTSDNLMDTAIDVLTLFPTMLQGVLQGNERQRRLQDQVIATQRQLIDELSARKQVEEAIRFQARLLDAVEEAVIAVDCDGVIIYWNRVAALLYGWSTAEALSQRFDLILDNAASERAHALIGRLCAGSPWSGEVQVKRRDGLIFPVLMTNSPISDQGRPIGSVSISIDITSRKRAEEERLTFERKLLETQKLESLGLLAGGVAHDFNNLLMTILGNAGLALLDLEPDHPARQSLTQIEQATQHAADLTRQLLAYAGKAHFIVQPLNLNTIVEEMTHLLQVSIPKSVTLRYNLTPQLPPIEADAAQIRQIVMNLVINAAQAIGDKNGIISITTGAQFADQPYLAETYIAPDLPEGQYVFLEVSDTGRGMDAATRARIFEPFFTTKSTGYGLGLAAVLGVVRGHNGALNVYSEPGRGSTFKCLLPAAPSNTSAELAGRRLPSRWRAIGTALVIDDEESVRMVAARMLEQFGFTVLVAENGDVGIELFRAHAAEIVCVLLDMTMPQLDGEAVFRAMRQIKPGAHVILMSGYTEQDVTIQFAGKGLAGFLAKPFTVDELRARLEQALAV